MNKRGKIKAFILLGVFVLSIIFISLFVKSNPPQTIHVGDSAYTENQYGKIWIDNDKSSGFLTQIHYLNLSWYSAPTDLDIAFKLDAPTDALITDKRIFYLTNYSHEKETPTIGDIETSYFCNDFYGIENATAIWCNNQSMYYRYDAYSENISGIDIRLNKTGIIGYTYPVIYYEDWEDRGVLNLQEYNEDKYYFKTNMAFETGETKQLKIQYKTPKETSGKFDVYMKKSVDTIADAFTNGKYLLLDPAWNSTLNSGLWAYYSLNESTGNFLDSTGNSTGNQYAFANSINRGTATTIHNGAVNFTANGDHMNISNYPTNIPMFSYSLWVYSHEWDWTATEVGSLVREKGTEVSVDFWLLIVPDTNNFEIGVLGTGGWRPTGFPSNNQWHMITITYDGSTLSYYLDGIKNSTISRSVGNINTGSTSGVIMIGNAPDGTVYWPSKTYQDEFAFWTRNLTNTEVSDLWNNGQGIFFEPTLPDTIPPITTMPILNSTDGTDRSNQDLNCYATLTDNQQTSLTANWRWYKNNVSELFGDTFVINGTPTKIKTLSAGNTTKGDKWKCEVTPYDGFNFGIAKNSSSLTILNSIPTHSQPLLSTSTGKNLSTEDLTCTNQSTSDVDNDVVTNIFNWYKDFQPFLVLNMPFESNFKDYSGNNNDGINNGATSATGKVGQAFRFDGVDDFVNLSKSNSLINLNTTFSVEAWVFSNNNTGQHLILDNCETLATEGYCLLILDNEFRFHVGKAGAPKVIAGGAQTGQWHHVVGTYDNENAKIYVDGNLINTTSVAGPLNKAGDEDLVIGHNSPSGINKFDGVLDEFRIYSHALTQQQVYNNFNLNYNKIVKEETVGSDNYMCQVTPNDAEADGVTLNSSSLEVLWGITFNVTYGETGEQEPNFNINCNNSFSASGISSPYTTGFLPGNYECTFTKPERYDKTITFTADNDKKINVTLSRKFSLTIEEHTWLEAIYNCINGGDCSMYNLLLDINNTVGNIWDQTKPTDESVITFENITNRVVNSTRNLTIDYSVYIPIKGGYNLGAYLPVRIGYWFLNESNTTCFNQGDKPTGVSEPYCQPLIVETIGPMGGSVNFTVKLRPQLPSGNYSFKRIIDIDPNNVWINYGQEVVSSFTMLESLNSYGISLETTEENIPDSSSDSNSKSSSLANSQITSDNKETNIKSSGITGGIIGIGDKLLSGWQIVAVIAILGLVIVVFIISKTMLKLKEK